MYRRDLLIGAGAVLTLTSLSAPAWADRPQLVAYRTPNCGCCLGWVEHIRQAGFAVRVVNLPQLDAVHRTAGVPPELASCHLSLLDRFAFSGHVPAPAIRRFLASPGSWRGLAVAGMPVGSPGMEVQGQRPETYEVRAFGQDGHHERFAQARGGNLM